MTKKDYVVLAEMMKQQHYRARLAPHANTAATTIADIEEGLANICERDNPRFDRGRFLQACRVV